MARKLPRQKFPYPAVDSIIHRGRKVLLVSRKEPIAGQWAIPGGFLEWGETFEDATVREAREETGLKIKLEEIVGAYSDPRRDVRGHLVGVVFAAKPVGGKLKISDEHSKARWFDIEDAISLNLHSDHKKILKDFAKWLKRRGTYWSKR